MGAFYVSNGCFWSKVVISAHLAAIYGVPKTLQIFPLNVFNVPFGSIRIHFNHCKNRIQIFNFCLFNRLYRESEVTVGSGDPLQRFFKGHICTRGVMWNTF